LEKRDDVVKEIRRRGGQNNVIDIKKKIGNLIIRVINKERVVGTRRRETDCLQKGRKALKPGSRSLFETVERFLKETNMIGQGRIFKA
jgi:hypothetical protein